jgi:hypothetical protein
MWWSLFAEVQEVVVNLLRRNAQLDASIMPDQSHTSCHDALWLLTSISGKNPRQGRVSAGFGCGWARSGSEAPDRNPTYKAFYGNKPQLDCTRVLELKQLSRQPQRAKETQQPRSQGPSCWPPWPIKRLDLLDPIPREIYLVRLGGFWQECTTWHAPPHQTTLQSCSTASAGYTANCPAKIPTHSGKSYAAECLHGWVGHWQGRGGSRCSPTRMHT